MTKEELVKKLKENKEELSFSEEDLNHLDFDELFIEYPNYQSRIVKTIKISMSKNNLLPDTYLVNKYYMQYYFAILTELYSIIYFKTDMKDLDDVIEKLLKEYPEIKPYDTSLFEHSLEYMYKTFLFQIKESDVVINEEYIRKYLRLKSSIDFKMLCIERITPILEKIYTNKEILQDYPTFINGMFTKYLIALPSERPNNVGYMLVISSILEDASKTLKDAPLTLKKLSDAIVSYEKIKEKTSRSSACFELSSLCETVYDKEKFYLFISENKICCHPVFDELCHIEKFQIDDILYFTYENESIFCNRSEKINDLLLERYFEITEKNKLYHSLIYLAKTHTSNFTFPKIPCRNHAPLDFIRMELKAILFLIKKYEKKFNRDQYQTLFYIYNQLWNEFIDKNEKEREVTFCKSLKSN